MQILLILTALLAVTTGPKEGGKPDIKAPAPPLELRLVVPEKTAGAIECSNDEEALFASPVAVIDHSHVRKAFPFLNGLNYAISVGLNKEGGEIMYEFTEKHKGERLAILVDGKLISAPMIQGIFGPEFQITGNFNEKEAKALADAITSKPKMPNKGKKQKKPDAEKEKDAKKDK